MQREREEEGGGGGRGKEASLDIPGSDDGGRLPGLGENLQRRDDFHQKIQNSRKIDELLRSSV